MATVALATPPCRVYGNAAGSRSGTLLALLAIAAVDIYCAQALSRERRARDGRPHDWSHRSGFPQPAEAMRGAASDFVPGEDMRTPELLQHWTQDRGPVH